MFVFSLREEIVLIFSEREREKEIVIEGAKKDCGKRRQNYSEKEKNRRDGIFSKGGILNKTWFLDSEMWACKV